MKQMSRNHSHHSRNVVLLLILTVMAPAFGAEASGFDPKPWIEDLHQIRTAFSEKYANFEWAVLERELDLSDLFARTETRLQEATSDAEARAAIDRLTRTLGDAHVRVQWAANRSTRVSAGSAPTPQASPDVCQALGYDSAKSGRALGPHIPGYQALPDTGADEFPAGFIQSAGQRVGVIRIGLFSPEGFPQLCTSILRTMAIQPDSGCDRQCADRVEKAAYEQLSRDLATRIRMLERLGATMLLIDLTGNGGGSQWVEAAVRVVSPLKLRSERRDFVRGAHWADNWDSIARDLHKAADEASSGDKQNLLQWATQVERAKAEALSLCSSAPFWSGRHPDCAWLGRGFYATGLLPEADAAALGKKPWGSLVFSPAKYHFEEGVWHGPLLVLVDGGTASAAEEFAAVLQDNRAAVVIGAPTAGGGCGHTNGGTPTTLTNSGAILELPDCARIRLDGSNEVSGIDPDIVLGFRSTDGMRRKGMRLAGLLRSGIAAAVRLCKRQHCDRQGHSQRQSHTQGMTG